MTADGKANGIVVFLRTMEYYRGILFLTTNRVGNFDDAFVSRIHTVIHYDGFTDVERKRIWEQFFKKLGSERRTTMKIDPDAPKYVLHHDDVKTIQWNGREIRNGDPIFPLPLPLGYDGCDMTLVLTTIFI